MIQETTFKYVVSGGLEMWRKMSLDIICSYVQSDTMESSSANDCSLSVFK